MPKPAPNTHVSPAYLLSAGAFLVLTWGSAFTLIDVIVRTLDPAWLVAYRLLIGAVLVSGYVKLRGLRFPKLSDVRWRWYSVMGLLGAALPFVLVSTGQRSIDSGLTAILIGAMPLITVVLAHFFAEERLTVWKSLGFLLGFCGLIILFLPKDLSLALVSDWQAQALVLTGATSYAVATIVAARAPETPSAVGGAMLLITACVMAWVWALAVVGPPPLPTPTVLSCLLALSVGSTAIATIVYLRAIEVAGPSFIAKVNYFVPICSVALGVMFLRETVDWRLFIALIVIIAGLIVSRIKSAP